MKGNFKKGIERGTSKLKVETAKVQNSLPSTMGQSIGLNYTADSPERIGASLDASMTSGGSVGSDG